MLDPRKVKRIVIHCSATKEGADIDMSDIEKMHIKRGFDGPGYHLGVKTNGQIEIGRSLKKIGAHAKGFNSESVSIVYYGGLDNNGNPKDTRTVFQRNGIIEAVNFLKLVFPYANEVVGHRDLSPDLNNDGEITPNEWMKQCPCFDVKSEFR